MSGRGTLKRVVEQAATRLGVARIAERAHRSSVAILSYHNIVPAGEVATGDRSLHLRETVFRDHLDILQTHYRIISLDELAGPSEGRAPRVAITFDDAYAGAVVAGIAEMTRRGLPATVFVSPGLLDRHSFWWDRLADEGGGVACERREHALWSLAGGDDAVRTWMTAEGIPERSLPEHALSATRAELEVATAHPRITVGAHGHGHLNMAALDSEALARELREPADSLARDWATYRPWVAYPYGLMSDAVEAAAREQYELGLRIEGGLARPGVDRPHAMARINVPAGLTPRGLRLRVSGVFS